MSELDTKMEKTIENLRHSFSTVRTGRANPDLLSKVKVEAYGSLLPLNQVASVHVVDNQTLSITPFDRSTIGDVDKGIQRADLGLNPVNDGVNLRIVIPMLTEERRKEMDKIVKKFAEEARIAIRNIRRDSMDKVKANKDFTEDELKHEEHSVQRSTDKFIALIDDLVKSKEKELMEV